MPLENPNAQIFHLQRHSKMKAELHPTYFPEATVSCACGNSWTTGATKEQIRVEICGSCHPFFTGEQRIVDTEGRVERLRRRFGIE